MCAMMVRVARRAARQEEERAMMRRLGPALLLLLFAAACGRAEPEPPPPTEVPGGDAGRGADALGAYGCGACHVIPGVPDAASPLGPSLAGLALRRELTGGLPNTPENLMRWIQNPQEIDPGTGMPDLEVTDADARHMAAYLYTLR
jgi:cytochrome c